MDDDELIYGVWLVLVNGAYDTETAAKIFVESCCCAIANKELIDDQKEEEEEDA